MIYLTTDHSGLNKFHGTDDENFCLVRPEIQRMVQDAPQKIEARNRSYAVVNEKDFHIDFSLKGIPVVSRFVARDAEMNQLRQELVPISANVVRRTVFVLHGLGGIGKTQLSIEFARKYCGSYSAIFWIDGSSKERLKQSIANLASRLPQHQILERARSYSLEKRSNVDEVVEEVLKWLSQPSNNQWLLIFDNVDREFSASSTDPEAFDVYDYFPEADQGYILITSRLASLYRLGFDMKLEPVDEVQGNTVLENSYGKSVQGSSKLVSLLHGLPLAITQAGSYMRETGTNVPEYIESYDHAWKSLMTSQNRFTRREHTDRSAECEDATNLLRLWAFLDNQDLWYGLLSPALNHQITDEIPAWFARCAGNEFKFKECIRFLLKYSFIDAKTDSSSFSIHPVFHHWCLYAFEADDDVMSRLAVNIVASAVPSETTQHHWLIQRRLLPHCDRIFPFVQQRMAKTLGDEKDFWSQSKAYHGLGILYMYQDRPKEAETMYLWALAGCEEVWGPGHSFTLDTVQNLGCLYMGQGKMKEAEGMYLRALTGFEKALGADHSRTLRAVSNLGSVYMKQGKAKEAEEMYLRALTRAQKAPAREHTSTLKTIYNLGFLYSGQDNKTVEAEKMYLKALTGFEKTLGREHTSTLNTANSLGLLYSKQGKLKEAEELYLWALIGYQKSPGPNHTRTLGVAFNFGNLYMDQGKMDEAEEMYQRALTGFEKALGQEHTTTLNTVFNLGNLYSHQDTKMVEAEEMYLKALTGFEKTLGREHTSTLSTALNLGVLYSKQEGRLNEAEEMYLKALTGFEKTLGREHISTLNAVFNLGVLYKNQGKMEEAEKMYLRALSGFEQALSQEHESTALNLGILYSEQGRLNEAEEMYLKALTGFEKTPDREHISTLNAVFNLGDLKKTLGWEHTTTLNTALNLGKSYLEQGKLNEAEEMYLKALTGFEKTLGREHTSTLNTALNLGNLYLDQGKLNETEEMYLKALTGFEKTLGREHTSTLNTASNLGILYLKQGRLNEAGEMCLKALTGFEKTLGWEHTTTLNTVHDLGDLYKLQGNMEEAEKMYLRAEAGFEKTLGREHKSTLGTVFSLGILYLEQDKSKEAEEYPRAMTEDIKKGRG
ncbi:hypothetical protein MMC07_007492 [Pseudocyphellaria aurata]|nr:hypothetical protein [Pseudocyphellaria aurata]